MPDVMTTTYTIKVIADDTREIANNFNSGNTEADRKLVESSRIRLCAGDTLAWCSIQVVANYKNFKGLSDWKTGCSYKNISEFEASDYYGNMEKQALEDLIDNLKLAWEAYEELTAEA